MRFLLMSFHKQGSAAMKADYFRQLEKTFWRAQEEMDDAMKEYFFCPTDASYARYQAASQAWQDANDKLNDAEKQKEGVR